MSADESYVQITTDVVRRQWRAVWSILTDGRTDKYTEFARAYRASLYISRQKCLQTYKLSSSVAIKRLMAISVYNNYGYNV